MNIKLEYLYFDTAPSGYAHDDHEHPTYELVYYISGNGLVTKDGIIKKFSANTFSFTTPQCLHKRHYHADTEYLAIGFSFDDNCLVPSDLYKDQNSEVLDLLLAIKEEFLSRHSSYDVMIQSYITQILVILNRRYSPISKKEHSEDAMSYILRYIDTHYHEPIDIEKLSAISHYTPDYFRHKFKALTGESPAHYVLLRRLESTKEMLRWSEHSISYIASVCGFSTTSHFCYMFKKYNNCSPLQYRNAVQRESI